MSARWLVWLVVVAASPIGGCGGKVNLGERLPEQTTGDPSAELPGGLGPTVGELVAQLPEDTRFEHLAVAGDSLYLGNDNGVSRCQKANCVPSLEPLSTVRGGVASLQAYGSFLGIGYSGNYSSAWLATYSQPAGADEHVVFEDLPVGQGVSALLWYGGFVYWPLSIDQRVYRCALPDCEDGPKIVGSFTESDWSRSERSPRLAAEKAEKVGVREFVILALGSGRHEAHDGEHAIISPQAEGCSQDVRSGAYSSARGRSVRS